MRDRDHDGGVIVHIRGRVTAAEHVYAHDRVDRLRRLVPGKPFHGTVSIVAEGAPGAVVSASGEVHIDGQVARAEANGSGIRTAIDLLDERLRDSIERLGIGTQKEKQR